MDENPVVGEQNENKRRKLKSNVWAEFTKREIDGKAICNQCKGEFDGSSKKGTTHLRNHLKSKKCRDERKGGDGNEDKSITSMKEKSSVIDFIKSSFDTQALNSRKAEILQAYQEEMKSFSKLSCRFTLEFVEVKINADHPLLIVHYIDDSWEQQRKVIGHCGPNEYPIEAVKRICSDWKIDRIICSVVNPFLELDEGSWFSQQGSLLFAGSVPCLRGLVFDLYWLANSWETVKIDGLWRCVDYAYHISNKIKLQSAVSNAKTMGKKVISSDFGIKLYPIKYIETAVGLKEAFSELEKIDPHFSSLNLTKIQWDEATATFEHLKVLQESFYNCSDNYNTGIKDILKLVRCNRSEDCHVCKVASNKIKKNIGQYWSEYRLILDTLVILDPRFKMKTVQHLYEEIYSSDVAGYLKETVKCFRDVYDKYAIAGDANSSKSYKMLDAMGRPCTSSPKSEIDVYLDELQVPAVEEFDILAWWRDNAAFYPTLARMARDYLAIPISLTPYSFLKEIENWKSEEIDNEILPALINFKYGCN